MTKFEKDSLATLLWMLEKELEANSVKMDGKSLDKTIKQDKLSEMVEKVHIIRAFVSIID